MSKVADQLPKQQRLCRFCRTEIHPRAVVCPHCGRDQRAWYSRPLGFATASVGLLAAIVGIIAGIRQLIPDRSRLTYSLIESAATPAFMSPTGRLLGRVKTPDGGWERYQELQFEEADHAAISAALDILDTLMVRSWYICVSNRSRQTSDSLHVVLRVPGWLAGLHVSDPLEADPFRQLVQAPGTREGWPGWEWRTDGLVSDGAVLIRALWFPPLDSLRNLPRVDSVLRWAPGKNAVPVCVDGSPVCFPTPAPSLAPFQHRTFAFAEIISIQEGTGVGARPAERTDTFECPFALRGQS